MGRGNRVVVLVIACGLFLAGGGVAAAEAPEWVELVVTHDHPLTGDDARGSSLDRIGVHVERVRQADVAKAKRHWRSQRGVVDVRESSIYRAAYTPTDPSWTLQWESQQVEVDVAWDTTMGSSDVIIAILDTGVNTTLPDFAGKIAPGGHDYVNNDSDPSDDDGHGTEVALVAGAGADDESNNAGYCPDCRVLPMKVLDASGEGSDADIAEAILDAVASNADIINMSLAGDPGQGLSPGLALAIEAAADAGVLMIGSAGNEDSSTMAYPAAHPDVVGVAGVRLPDDNGCPGATAGGAYPILGANEPRCGFSNYGPWVSVSASGCNSTYFDGIQGVSLFCGTSSAAPAVAGIAGLIVAHHPTITAAQLRGVLERRSLDVVPDDGGIPVAEWGRVSPTRSLQACLPFGDVPGDHMFCEEIAWMALEDISTGFADGTYRPSAVVTRQAMAAFMARLAGAVLPPCTSPPFSDVPTSHTFCKEIAWMADAGISTGFPDGTFRPGASVTRQAMAAFMARLAEAVLTPCVGPPFDDVPSDHAFCEEIAWMADEGISTGFPDGTFRPANVVTRQAMAAFMFRLDQLT